MLIVQLCDFGTDGDARYRVHDPSRAMGRIPGVTSIDCHFFSRFLPELMEQADVLVLQFVKDWELTGICQRRRSAGRVTVFEANDFFFDLQPWNPIAPHWQDRTVQELYLQLLALADGVQTSSEELARRWRRLGARDVAVFPNHLTHVPPLPAVPERPLTVGWAGSPGHLADLYDVAPHLQRWLDANPDVRLAVMTSEPGRAFFRLPPERYHFEGFNSLEAYLRFLQRLDIGLAPLLPTDYNRCRSDVKFLEYASQGVAGIYADLEPYAGTVLEGETGLLYRTNEQLIQQLERLRTDRDLRLTIRQQGHAYVARERQLPDQVGARIDWYRRLLRTPAVPRTLPQHVMTSAVREAGYLQLPPQEPEQTLRDALQLPTSAQAAPVLTQLTDRVPQFLPALQSLGRVLNDLRQHRPAMRVLERARVLQPDSARTLSEIGRAWYRLNDDANALATLRQAIDADPHFLPGWQYLLRMMAVNKDPGGPALARRAMELFPNCYPLALLGATTHPPSEVPAVLLDILNHAAPSLGHNERGVALAAFREAILAAAKAAPPGTDLVPLLARAAEVFPESPRFASLYGDALLAAGRPREAHAQHARALDLRRRTAVVAEEFKADEPSPLAWQFAEHIDSKCR